MCNIQLLLDAAIAKEENPMPNECYEYIFEDNYLRQVREILRSLVVPTPYPFCCSFPIKYTHP